jgi:hypothetical protein
MRMAWSQVQRRFSYIIAAIVIVVAVLARILFAREFLDFLRLLTS